MYGFIFGKELSDILLSFLCNFLLFFSGAWWRHLIVIKKKKNLGGSSSGLCFFTIDVWHYLMKPVTSFIKKMCYMNNSDNKNVA